MVTLPFNDTAALTHYKLLKPHIEKRIKAILKNGILKDGNRITAKGALKFYLQKLPGSLLEGIIISRPSMFSKIITEIVRDVPGVVNKQTQANKILYNLFVSSTYDNKIFNKLKFVSTTGTDTCPYCNRVYIYSLDKKDKIKPPIDHFFPKSKYPFLAISFYNLIPSCSICNGLEAKNEADPIKARLKNPYLISSSDFVFTFKFKKVGIASAALDSSGIEIKFTKSLKGHIKIFKLQKLYDYHTDHVAELILKQKVKYPKSYRDDLTRFGLTADEIDRMLLGNYSLPQDVHKRPLAKLYQDIGRELKIIV